jgi:hypothetical protein
VVGRLDTFALLKELTALQARVNMLRVEIEIAQRQVPLVAAQRAGEAADAAAHLPQARVALAEVSDVQRYRLAEAKNRVEEAGALLTAAERKAARLRADAERLARAEYPPALDVLQERLAKIHIDVTQAEKDWKRVVLLVDDGAVASQAGESAQARYRALKQEEAAATSELVAAEKQLREEAEDAEIGVARARAVYRAAQQNYRQVERQAAPARVAAAREEIGARQRVARAAVLRQ